LLGGHSGIRATSGSNQGQRLRKVGNAHVADSGLLNIDQQHSGDKREGRYEHEQWQT
jgi:hypothetical protein